MIEDLSRIETPARRMGAASELATFLIKPDCGLPSLGLQELRDYRELLYFLTW
jgi:hypothetical protein